MFDVVCAGHICLDITPDLSAGGKESALLTPGKLTEAGALVMSAGGSVANTGLALVKLGVKTGLMGKVGNDIAGKIIANILEENGGDTRYLSVTDDASSSYSIVLAQPGADRIFIHDPAVNDTFGRDDIDFGQVRRAKILHVGYPTAMSGLSENDGKELTAVLREAKRLGAATSLDTSYPDTGSENGGRDWEKVFARALPWTDIFMPSIEEALWMFDRAEFTRLKKADGDILENLDIDYLPGLGGRLAAMGAGIVVIKCGVLGYYVKTPGAGSLEKMGRGAPQNPAEWSNKEIFSGTYHVGRVKSATGAGDTSIAGFLAALLNGASAMEAADIACAAGAACVTEFSAADGIPPLGVLVSRHMREWKKRPPAYAGTYFAYDDKNNVLAK